MKTAGFSLGQQLASGARISRKHFTLVADDGATATSFAAAATIVAQRVQQATGITITAEPDLLAIFRPMRGCLHCRLRGRGDLTLSAERNFRMRRIQ